MKCIFIKIILIFDRIVRKFRNLLYLLISVDNNSEFISLNTLTEFKNRLAKR